MKKQIEKLSEEDQKLVNTMHATVGEMTTTVRELREDFEQMFIKLKQLFA